MNRCYQLSQAQVKKAELHIFCDASSRDYEVEAYWCFNLAGLKKYTNAFETFVFNRIREIHDKSKALEWRWINSEWNATKYVQ
uniref:Uncharacterized protein n=1 Tax=Trichogramma kaykai TaxID=54128 RepID=A0ABD2X9E2_9HYME